MLTYHLIVRTDEESVLLDGAVAYRVRIVRDHILMRLGGRRVLLDLGSPVSFAVNGRIKLCRQLFPVPRLFPGTGFAGLSTLVGERIDAVLGCDLIGHFFAFLVDWQGTRVIFYTRGHSEFNGSDAIPLRVVHGLPIVDCMFNGRNVPFCPDSGAPAAYALPELLEGSIPVGTVDDHHPFFGNFRAATYRATFQVGPRVVNARLGYPPGELELMLRIGGFGILAGADFYRLGPVAFDFRQRKLHLFESCCF